MDILFSRQQSLGAMPLQAIGPEGRDYRFFSGPFPDPRVPSIFLAGPTPRDPSVASWRPAAYAALAAQGFEGLIFSPETAPLEPDPWHGPSKLTGQDREKLVHAQTRWEQEALGRCHAILFWVDRKVKGGMPGLTTNVEYGLSLGLLPHKIVYGRPPTADRVRYLDQCAKELDVVVKLLCPTRETLPAPLQIHDDIDSTVAAAIALATQQAQLV